MASQNTPSCERCKAPSASPVCISCRKVEINAEPDAVIRRAKAGRARLPFLATCETHGLVDHAWQHGRCLTCFTGRGELRLRPWAAEAASRGARWGFKRCAVHGHETPHSLRHRKCLLCFSTNGLPRVRPVGYFKDALDEFEQRRLYFGVDVETWRAMTGGDLEIARAVTPGLGSLT